MAGIWQWRLAVGGALAVFGLQSLFMTRYPEPYPAIMMPGFKGGGGFEDGNLKLRLFEVEYQFEDGPRVYAQKDVLGEFPDSHFSAITNYVVPAPERPEWKSMKTGLAARLRDSVLPGYGLNRFRTTSDQKKEAFGKWLLARGKALASGEEPRAATLRWLAWNGTLTESGLSVDTHAVKEYTYGR